VRAAAIFGLGSSERDLRPFQKESETSWLIGLPARSSEAEVVLIFGGDGTVHRHLPQLVKLGLPVLVVPCGSGNDFARALKLGSVRDSLAAWRRFCSGDGNVRPIDLGTITPLATSGEVEVTRYSVLGTRYYFCCVAGVGLDGAIARRANRLPPWVRGHGGYVLSLLPELLRFAPFPMKILASTGQPESFTRCSEKPTVLAAFANTPAYGGGMKIAPNASFDDGQLDVCVVTDVNPFKLFLLFPTVYFGRHLRLPEVEYFQADRLRMETERPFDVYADGEYVCSTPIEVGVEARALPVVVI
jgi:diacylglycerol kinase (ATP)